MKLLLGSEANTNAVNVNYQLRLNLNNSNLALNDSILSEIVDESLQFQTDRNNCNKYITYGKLESLIDDSLNFNTFNLNTTNYNFSIGYAGTLEPTDFSKIIISGANSNTINININSNVSNNDVVLIYKTPANFIVTKVLDIISNNGTSTVYLDSPIPNNDNTYVLIPSVATYKRKIVNLLDSNFINIYSSAFSTNIFNTGINQFNTFKDINVSGLTDNFNFPITQLFLKISNPNITTTLSYQNGTNTDIDVNTIDVISYDLNQLVQINIDNVICNFSVLGTGYYFKPILPMNLQYYSSYINSVTTATTFDFPSYAFMFNNGDLLYKNLLSPGIFENGVGLNYPFLNNYNYIYNDFKYYIRRTIPIANYSGTTSNDTVVYNQTLVNSNTGAQRLC